MAETQRPLSTLPHPFLGNPFSRSLQPIQLPPLNIPQYAQHRVESRRTPTRSLPAIQSSPQSATQPSSRSSQAVPLEKLLSSHPYTPPRSDPRYSPKHEAALSPRSSVDSRTLARPGAGPVEDRRTANAEPHHFTPLDLVGRPPITLFPLAAYAPSYQSGSNAYQAPFESHRSSGASSFGPSSYQETAITPSARPSTAPHPHLQSNIVIVPHELRVRQQPIAARACGNGERDRRVIDPPPIIQLIVRDPITGIPDTDELRYCHNVVHCTLWSADGTSDETPMAQPDRRMTRRLMGQVVASPSIAKDEHDVEGCFFCFPDLSCRTSGRYRLRFVLMRIDPVNLHVGGFSPIITEVLSDVFTVYAAKDFPGMRPSSALTRALKMQGCNIQVKKGSNQALTRKRAASSDGEEDPGGRDPGRNKQRRRQGSTS